MKIFVNGHNLYIEATGPKNGSPVVLLHHGLGSVRAWRGQIPALNAAGFRVVVYDRWGYGESDSRPGLDLPTFQTDLKDLDSLLEYLEIQRTTLLGHSDGGTIALYYAIQQPERVSCLVTVAAHVYVESKMKYGIAGIRQSFETDERFRRGMQSAHGEKYQAVFHNWYQGWYRKDILSWDMRPLLRLVSCPALIVQGELDEHASPQHANDIAGSIPGADLWLVPDAGHMLPQENSVEFNLRMLRFIQSCVTVEVN